MGKLERNLIIETAGINDRAGTAALAAWVKRGLSTPIDRWLDRLLDPEGVPRTLPVPLWCSLLRALDQARGLRPEDWPERLDARIEGLFRATLRFARTDGAAVFAASGAEPDVPALFRGWAERLSDPGLATVVDWWFPRKERRGEYASPPLPAWSSPETPLAILRANWSRQGDFLAIDHRSRGASSMVELTGSGRTWLGPTWVAEFGPGDAPVSRSRPSLRVSNPSVDLVEWTFRLGASRVTRTALLLRGRRIALLADQVEGPAQEVGMRIALPEGVEATAIDKGRGPGWVLSTRRGRQAARVVPFGLPRLAGASGRGKFEFETEGGHLRLGQHKEGRRCWLPLLLSWDTMRDRQVASWRDLTVAENSRTCPPDTAFAARVSWGRGETLLIYRSLAPPALRSFLGHQTRARFLVALFNRDGNVVPIVKVD